MRLPILLVAGFAVLFAALSGATQAADWLPGGTSTDWNTGTNWNGGVVPNNAGAFITSNTGNIATISANPVGPVTELQVGTWSNNGRLDHTAGSLTVTNTGWPYGWLLLGGGTNGTGTYNIANTAATGGALTGFGTGSGSLSVNGEIRVGAGSWWDHATGVLNVNTSGTVHSNGSLIAGTNVGDVGTVNLDAGAFTVFGDYTNSAQFGSGGSSATGNLNISGGSFTLNNRLTLGVGTGTSAGGNVATVTMTGGTLTTDVGHNEDWHAGVNMASGYDTATGGTATFNLNGGTLSTLRVFSETGGTGIKGTSTFNFNGGTLQAQDSRTNFMDSLTRANVRNGGAIVDTNGFDVTISQALLHSNIGGDNATDGGLTKNGTGVLVLSNVDNSFNGNIVVNGGTLRANAFRNGYPATGNLGANDGSRTITVNTGATLDFTNNNIFAGGGATAAGLPQLVLNGGTMQSSRFNVLGHVTLNGGTLNQSTTDTGGYEGYEFLGNITVGGTAASTISSSNDRANHISGGHNMLVTVADATSSSAADLIISNPLRDGSGDYSGNGAITKAGAGTLQLTAANTYSGGSTVSAGTLEVNNTSGSGTGDGTVTVDAGAKLTGDGMITTGSNNYVYVNGTLQVGAIGASAGSDFSLTTSGTGSTILGSSSLLAMDLWSTTGTDMTGTLAAADMLRLFGTLDIMAGSTLLLNNPNALTFQAGDMFRLFDWTGITTRTGTFTTDFSDINLGSGLSIDTSNLYTQGTISILGAVPEPSRALLVMFGAAGLMLRRRRQLGSTWPLVVPA
ncbi:autotransporter-associated beta strand repeat-containing protein [Prosthecobacter sp.]|uniref:autotransporter-associated beta strand repeat-containing protein n=1 Tax=Prosthecobacter sp. TaxID=1965333 RepID=UPI002ABB7A05|nr:autotransporter-associated beta strand repeat-containing protein [Prosthecobacter sp.]MDZ4402886.1 autotransporter-associated beta strand repeat-containing protein [Prosthecobacter sp.]